MSSPKLSKFKNFSIETISVRNLSYVAYFRDELRGANFSLCPKSVVETPFPKKCLQWRKSLEMNQLTPKILVS